MADSFNQTKRVYPQLPPNTHPSIVQAFNDLHDHVYSLRDQVQKMQASAPAADSSRKKPFTQDFGGIPIKANLDSTVLVTGNSFKYNASTGQFELGP
jgi:hypothetical protein